MEIITNALLFLHFIGLARLIGGGLSQVSSPTKQINAGMFDGSLTQLVTGFALYAIAFNEANHMIVGLKILVLAVIVVLVYQPSQTRNLERYLLDDCRRRDPGCGPRGLRSGGQGLNSGASLAPGLILGFQLNSISSTMPRQVHQAATPNTVGTLKVIDIDDLAF